jgi:hypothetical protein
MLFVTALVLLAGCQEDKPRQAELPAAVAETRSNILRAAGDGDYDAFVP